MRVVPIAMLIAVLLPGCEKFSFDSKPVAPATVVATAPQYSPDSDPARTDFEKALDLIQAISEDSDQQAEAVGFVEQMVRNYPDSPYPLIAAADLQYRLTIPLEGVALENIRTLINQSFKKSRAIPDAYVVLAKLDLDRKKVASAAESSDRAYKLAPDKPEVRFVMARVAQSKKSYEDAEQHYRKYLEVSQRPARQSNIYIWMAGMFAGMDPPQLDKADDAYKAALKLDPKAVNKIEAYAHYLLYLRGDYEGTLFYLEQALQAGGESPNHGLAALAVYAKWADGYANKSAHYKARTERGGAPLKVTVADLRKVEATAGVSADEAFVELAAAPALDYAVRSLLKAKLVKNIDIKTTGRCGCTAMTKAADANNLELVKFLIANKANVNGTNATGETVLTRFILQKNWAAVGYVLDHGARVNFADKDGMTPLEFVQTYADADITGFRLLLEHKADPTIPLDNGYTYLTHAVLARNAELVALLVKHGADPNEKEGYKTRDKPVPMLMLAARYGFQDMVTALLNAGADPMLIEEENLKALEKTSPATFKMIADARTAHPRSSAANSEAAGGRSSQSEASVKK